MNQILSAIFETRDRIIASLGLTVLVILGWIWNIHLIKTMGSMPVSMPGMNMWTVHSIVVLWTMWFVMMVATMLPSVSPTVLTFAAIERKNTDRSRAIVRTCLFLAGYVAGWTAFCVLVTGAQWALHVTTLLSPQMVSASVRLSGILLLLAGIFQWSSIKHECLSRCRSPIGFLLTEWREGPMGSAKMGFRHGVYCVGCCWLLMTLLFVVGVMNLMWVALLSVIVLMERVFPHGEKIAKFCGVLLFAWGAWLLI
jgi:predicted metal-binding membrane protein